MAILTFSLNPEALNKFYDALICMSKFSDHVSLEASADKLVLSTFNSSKSSYASFKLGAIEFFSKYCYKLDIKKKQNNDKFAFKIYNKALTSVFKGRTVDQTKEKETAIERCDAYVEDGGKNGKSRFVVKLFCRHGVRKIHRLTFESLPALHAIFDKDSASNYWSISSKVLREFAEHFGPGTEQLEIYSEAGRVNFTSSSEKNISGNEILKKPLHTTIAMDTLEFSDFNVEESLNIVISVKDFKSIVVHCGINNTKVNVFYSQPSYPMLLTYSLDGVWSEFILMTAGGPSITPPPNEKQKTIKKLVPRNSINLNSGSKTLTPENSHHLGQINKISTSPKPVHTSLPPPKPTFQSESLFLPQGDDDRRWEPADFDDESEEILLWDAENKGPSTVILGRHQNAVANKCIANDKFNMVSHELSDSPSLSAKGLPPTQKLSQVLKLGLFD